MVRLGNDTWPSCPTHFDVCDVGTLRLTDHAWFSKSLAVITIIIEKDGKI